MSNKAKYMIAGLIAALAICAVAAVIYMNNKYDVINNISELKESAEKLYAEGNIEDAIFRMESYCNNVVTDIEAKATLGDWYMETGDESKAYSIYYEAAMRKKPVEERIAALTARNTKKVLTEPIDEIVLEITPDVRCTKNMTLTVTGHNLVPEKVFEGKITDMEAALTEEDLYYTTDWFEVDPDGKYLTMSGGFNCAIWQFKDENGVITNYAESANRYRTKDTYSTNVYQMARVIIPETAAKCRVTYFDLSKKEETSSTEEKLTIVYGRMPGESRETNYNNYKIPDLKEGEKIVYENNEWKFVTDSGETVLSDWEKPCIEKGSYFAVNGTLPGKVSFEKSTYASYSKDGIYTIQFDVTNPSATGERLDDAKNLAFNADVGTSKFNVGENHFDNIYPWSEMKLCAIKDGKITYAGESGFTTNGSAGDVFVEIPKFYFKRTVGERYDTISISGEKHEGFEVDEAFLTKNGEADKIYIAAYLTGSDKNGFNSCAGESPVLNLTPDEIKKGTEAKGEGYRELDYAALSAVQKLFLVETGIRNSQYLFMGICAYSLPSNDIENISVAINSKTKTNCIEISREYTFIEGNNIVLFDIDNYENSISSMDVREITAVIADDANTQSVYFSGDPVTVKKGKTAIAHIATSNGTTGSVSGHTGTVSTERGTVAFKYRGIENLWGNTFVYIDSITVKNSVATITDRRGNKHDVLYKLPQHKDDVYDSMINKIGYDVEYNGIMLPCLTGEGATISTHYGDAYFDNGEENTDNALYYGGAWNSRATAGLFAYTVASKEARINASGRMMYIK